MYNLTNKIKVVDLALLVKDTLIISDIHIGYEEELNKRGVMLPRLSFKDIMVRLEKILKEVHKDVKTIVINGDLKHEFGKISEQEWRETLQLIDFLAKFGKLILVKGNHDAILGPIADKRNVELVNEYKIDDILILHGDKLIDIPNGIKTIIIGHEHPAISLQEENRKEKFKCFLKGKYEGKTLIVMPSFNPITEGSDVLQEKKLSPYLQMDLGEFEVFIISDKIYEFGKLKNLL